MKKKKDILFACQFFYPEYISSATLPYDTACALRDSGFSVDALCGYPKEYSQGKNIPLRESVDGITIRRLKYIQLKRSGFLGRLINYFSFSFMVFLNLWRFAGYRAVVVYSNPPILPWIASWAKVLFGTKLYFVAYDVYPELAVQTHALREGSIICRLMEHINRCVYRRADGVVALSHEMREFLLKNRPIAPERVFVIPNWYEDQKQDTTEENEFAQITAGRFVVSYFGNMGICQDMQTILEGMRLLKEDENVFFLFAGHGNKMEALKTSVQEEGLTNVRILDFLHGQQFQDALAISDCALVSLAEGTTGLCVPSKTYSYMMQGIPLLAIMDEGDIVRDVESGAGCWVRNGEARKLADAIRAMREDTAGQAAMRRKCRELYLENYTREVCTGKYVSLFLNHL